MQKQVYVNYPTGNFSARWASDCPEGWDTVVGWLAKNAPQDIDLHSANMSMIGKCLSEVACAAKLWPTAVAVPEAQIGMGFEHVNAYPVFIISAYFWNHGPNRI